MSRPTLPQPNQAVPLEGHVNTTTRQEGGCPDERIFWMETLSHSDGFERFIL